MCEYCTTTGTRKGFFKDSNFEIYIELFTNELAIDFEHIGHMESFSGYRNLKINFCPNCGKKIEEWVYE